MSEHDYSGLGVDMICQICGKPFVRLTEDWAYKTGDKYFCSWTCLNDYREKKTGNRLGVRDPDEAEKERKAKERERGRRRRAKAKKMKETRYEIYDANDIIPEAEEKDNELEGKE